MNQSCHFISLKFENIDNTQINSTKIGCTNAFSCLADDELARYEPIGGHLYETY